MNSEPKTKEERLLNMRALYEKRLRQIDAELLKLNPPPRERVLSWLKKNNLDYDSTTGSITQYEGPPSHPGMVIDRVHGDVFNGSLADVAKQLKLRFP